MGNKTKTQDPITDLSGIDDSHSLWMNPVFSIQQRLDIARGTIVFQQQIIDNLRRQLAAAKRHGETDAEHF